MSSIMPEKERNASYHKKAHMLFFARSARTENKTPLARWGNNPQHAKGILFAAEIGCNSEIGNLAGLQLKLQFVSD